MYQGVLEAALDDELFQMPDGPQAVQKANAAWRAFKEQHGQEFDSCEEAVARFVEFAAEWLDAKQIVLAFDEEAFHQRLMYMEGQLVDRERAILYKHYVEGATKLQIAEYFCVTLKRTTGDMKKALVKVREQIPVLLSCITRYRDLQPEREALLATRAAALEAKAALRAVK